MDADGLAGVEAEADGAATLTAFTAASVARSAELLPEPPVRWLVTGGGRLNGFLMDLLRRMLGTVVEPVDAVDWQGAPAIYRHTEKADRGFCAGCGSYLYWRERSSDMVDLSAGLFHAPTGLHLGPPSFTGNKGDYYDVSPWSAAE